MSTVTARRATILRRRSPFSTMWRYRRFNDHL
jgi:hypothetical protein